MLTNMLNNLDSFNRLKNAITTTSHTHISNIVNSQKSHIINQLDYNQNLSVVIVSDETRAKEVSEDLAFFYENSKAILIYPKKDILFYSSDVHSIDITVERFKIIKKILNNEPFILICTVESVFDKITPLSVLKPEIFSLETEMVIERDDLIKKLFKLGYKQADSAENIGQFSVRGGIIDIFSVSAKNAVRIEYFDNEIDSIRVLDSFAQKSIEKIDSIEIYPAREILIDESTLNSAADKIQKEYDKSLNAFIKKGLKEEADNLQNAFSTIPDEIRSNTLTNGIEKFINYFYSDANIILDYINKENTLIYIDEPVKVKNFFNRESELFLDSMKSKIMRGMLLPNMTSSFTTYDEFINNISKFTTISFSTVYSNFNDLNYSEKLDFNSVTTPIYKNRLDLLIKDIKEFNKSKNTIVVLTGNKTYADKLKDELIDENINLIFKENINDSLEKNKVYAMRGSLNGGFIYKDLNLVVISDKELFGISQKKVKPKKKKSGQTLSSFSDLKVGDYVVHEDHGIGIFNGIEKVTTDRCEKEYIKIIYAEEGKLFVPITHLDRVQKYIGGNEAKLKLNSLSNKEWAKAKTKTKRAVELIAKDLVELYAKRENSMGYVYSSDSTWQNDFEDTFEYSETDDQLNAIKDVKWDMESKKIMDRLICGDVGYGKTEVALRAAFKAVDNGKQVAYLCPTTILANQHYNNFCQRMKDFPVTVELLSRFKTKKEIDNSIDRLELGHADIAIGTHRLLSKDVVFKDLGLIIIDEEQRFGVKDKEKLKKIKENVDVLTLSATPIPRTLHMSLTNIRDISTLEEPPVERKPIQTFVMEYNDEFVKDAITRELRRNGQVYFVHNRVNNIEETTARIQKLAPDAVVTFAHGQMTPNQLEDIMSNFVEGEIDVLVCTTIIETGLDIQNANTIIINNANTMGLSQLYQLRGRVGRSGRSSYAYLMYKKDKVLSEIAEKRLQTIKEFTEFGSGFKISMRDLEIRGAGTVLGEEQSGHMELVGYDLYCKLLDTAVKELQGNKTKEDIETKIELSISALIGNSYISSELNRLEIYKKISFFTQKSDYENMIDELIDRFGEPPQETINLLKIGVLKMLCNNCNMSRISDKLVPSKSKANNLYNNPMDYEITFTFENLNNFDPVLLNEYLKENKHVTFKMDKSPFLKVISEDSKKPVNLDMLIDLASDLNTCLAPE